MGCFYSKEDTQNQRHNTPDAMDQLRRDLDDDHQNLRMLFAQIERGLAERTYLNTTSQ